MSNLGHRSVEDGLPVFVYTADQERYPPARWDPVLAPPTTRHWVHVGNRRTTLVADNEARSGRWDEHAASCWLTQGTGVSRVSPVQPRDPVLVDGWSARAERDRLAADGWQLSAPVAMDSPAPGAMNSTAPGAMDSTAANAVAAPGAVDSPASVMFTGERGRAAAAGLRLRHRRSASRVGGCLARGAGPR